MKVAVSIPDPTFIEADELAAKLGVSRSELYRRALERLLSELRGERITEQLDRVYGGGDGAVDSDLAAAQAEVYAADEEW
jgi:metal-responsive CopG/Arc/MetJ family transcriptional regulator